MASDSKLSTFFTAPNALLINGHFITTQQTLPVYNPATEDIIAHVPSADASHVDQAVRAARDCFESQEWQNTSGKKRAKWLRKIARKLNNDVERLALLEAENNGKTVVEAEDDIESSAEVFEYYAKLAEQLDKKQGTKVDVDDDRFTASLRYEAAGVVALITPFNYPLLMAAQKLAPAIAAGCTSILKPSEYTPLTTMELAFICNQILPVGAVNVIIGLGAAAGAPLVEHPEVDKVSFTGSVPTGSRIGSTCGRLARQCVLELGGKSPFLVFDDVLTNAKSLDEAVEWILVGIFSNNGQICSATSRLLLQEEVAKVLLPRLVEETKKIRVANPTAMENREQLGAVGPVVSKQQYDHVLRLIEQAKVEGATLLVGGQRAAQFEKGYFVEPTIFQVTPEHSLWREEVFGPVLCVTTFKDEAEAIRLAHDTEFGLAATVMTLDMARRKRLTKKLRVGILWLDCSQPAFNELPWGGLKKSGFGRELGPAAMDNFLEVKSVVEYSSEKPWGWFTKQDEADDSESDCSDSSSSSSSSSSSDSDSESGSSSSSSDSDSDSCSSSSSSSSSESECEDEKCKQKQETSKKPRENVMACMKKKK